MVKPEHDATRHIAAKATVVRQEEKGPLALGKACVLETGPLIAARRYEKKPSENIARACHRGIEDAGSLKCPLHQRGEQRESEPGKEIAGSEPNGCREWRAPRLGVPAHTCISENHWRHRGRHHGDHH